MKKKVTKLTSKLPSEYDLDDVPNLHVHKGGPVECEVCGLIRCKACMPYHNVVNHEKERLNEETTNPT